MENQRRNIFTRPTAVEPITGFLPSFQPVMNGHVESGTYKLTYKVVIWAGIDSETNTARTREGGVLTLQRRAEGQHIHYTVTQQRQHGQRLNRLHAECICTELNDALLEWNVTSTFLDGTTETLIPELTLTEKGQVRGDIIHVSDGRSNTEYHTTKPVFSLMESHRYISQAGPSDLANAVRCDARNVGLQTGTAADIQRRSSYRDRGGARNVALLLTNGICDATHTLSA